MTTFNAYASRKPKGRAASMADIDAGHTAK